MVNSVSCKCSLLPHKVGEAFLVLSEKEQYFYIEAQVSLNSLFSLCFFNLLLCCPTTNFWAIVEGTGSLNQCCCYFIAIFIEGQKEIRVNKFFLRLIAHKRFQRLYQDQLDFDILYTWRVNSTKGVEFDFLPCTLCPKSRGFYAKPGFFNTLSDDVYFYALNSELFQI